MWALAHSPGFQPGVRVSNLSSKPLQGRGRRWERNVGDATTAEEIEAHPEGAVVESIPMFAPIPPPLKGLETRTRPLYPGLKPGATGQRPQGALPPLLP